MFAQLYKWAAIVFAALAVALLLWCMFLRTSASNSDLRAAAAVERAHVLEAQVIRADQVIKAERAKAQRMAQVAEQYEQDKADAQAGYDRDLADLRSGNIKLRDEWATTATDAVSAASRSAAELDAGAAVRERLAAEIVRLGAEADAQVRGLQGVVRADRESSGTPASN